MQPAESHPKSLDCKQRTLIHFPDNVVTGTHLFQYRHISASFITENVASNLILEVRVFHQFLRWMVHEQRLTCQVLAGVPIDMVRTATAVRDALLKYREPYYIYNLMALKSKVMLEAANTGKQVLVPFDDNRLIVNSNVM